MPRLTAHKIQLLRERCEQSKRKIGYETVLEVARRLANGNSQQAVYKEMKGRIGITLIGLIGKLIGAAFRRGQYERGQTVEQLALTHQIFTLHKNGLANRQIAAQLGLTPQCVARKIYRLKQPAKRREKMLAKINESIPKS